MTVTLWGHWTCPYVNRVAFALAQRGTEYDLVNLPPSAVRPKDFVLPNEFVANSPLLEVPLIRVDGEYLADSIPILHLLEDRVLDHRVDERVSQLDATLMRSMGGVAYGRDPEKIQRSSDFLNTAFSVMADWLEESEWLAGDAPSLTEAIVVSIYLRLEGLRSLGFNGTIPEIVDDHRARTLDLPGGRHVAWDDEQRAEYLGRHLKARALG
ncbi:MAG: glutathione S-transferase [Candidatus Aldehydirespiratoraceae bacterium]|jgi:glutathione S-transferase